MMPCPFPSTISPNSGPGDKQKEVMIKLEGKFLPVNIHQPSLPFFTFEVESVSEIQRRRVYHLQPSPKINALSIMYGRKYAKSRKNYNIRSAEVHDKERINIEDETT
jgi:hypothetical protein